MVKDEEDLNSQERAMKTATQTLESVAKQIRVAYPSIDDARHMLPQQGGGWGVDESEGDGQHSRCDKRSRPDTDEEDDDDEDEEDEDEDEEEEDEDEDEDEEEEEEEEEKKTSSRKKRKVGVALEITKRPSMRSTATPDLGKLRLLVQILESQSKIPQEANDRTFRSPEMRANFPQFFPRELKETWQEHVNDYKKNADPESVLAAVPIFDPKQLKDPGRAGRRNTTEAAAATTRIRAWFPTFMGKTGLWITGTIGRAAEHNQIGTQGLRFKVTWDDGIKKDGDWTNLDGDSFQVAKSRSGEVREITTGDTCVEYVEITTEAMYEDWKRACKDKLGEIQL